MKRRNFGTNALQLAMAFILIFFGVILQTSGKDTVKNISLVLMLVPGIAMVIGFVMNYFTYPYYWSFPVILFCFCAPSRRAAFSPAPACTRR